MNPAAEFYLIKTVALFTVTALAEIVGCYLPLMWMQNRVGIWALLPAALSLTIFVWLLSLHPLAAGRVYAAYGGVYVSSALLWLWWVEGIPPDRWDVIGICFILIGMSFIIMAHRNHP